MSMKFREEYGGPWNGIGERPVPETTVYIDPEEDKTVQEAADDVDINRIIGRHGIAKIKAHAETYGAEYGVAVRLDYAEALSTVRKADEMFQDLPAEVRREFEGNPAEFINFLDNHTPEQILERLPQLAAPGTQLPDVIGGRASGPASPEGASTAASGGPGADPAPTSEDPDPSA